MKNERILLKRLLEIFSRQESLEELLPMSQHWNGYKRENAVRRLGKLGSPIALPYLITRANDWVPQVREAAKEAIVSLAVPENGSAFVLSLPELYHLENCRRDNHRSLISLIEDYLSGPELCQIVISGIMNESVRIARACFLLSLSKGLLDTQSILQMGLSHTDLIIRLKASDFLKDANGLEQKNAINIALKDTFMPIRREALQISLRQGASTEFSMRYLFDRHPSIREIAVNHLLKHKIDVSRLYADCLPEVFASTLRCAIWGIGHLQATEYIPQILPLLESQFPSVRKQSLICLSRLIGDTFNPTLKKFLSDSSPAVCKEAVTLTRKNAIVFDAEELIEIYKNSEFEHTKNSCFGILRRINKWESLIFILHVIEAHKKSTDIALYEKIDYSLKQWDFNFNKTSSQPTIRQLEYLKTLYLRLQDSLKDQRYKSIMFTLKTTGVVS